MKNSILLSLLLLIGGAAHAATTIDALNRYAYGANLGWMDWTGGSGETTTGAVIGEYVCSSLSVAIYTNLP